MTKEEIKNKIEALKKGINSPATPDNMKKEMQSRLEKLETELAGMKDEPEKKVVKPIKEKKPKVEKPEKNNVTKRGGNRAGAGRKAAAPIQIPKISFDETKKIQTIKGHKVEKITDRMYVLNIKGTDDQVTYEKKGGYWKVEYAKIDTKSFISLQEAVEYSVKQLSKGIILKLIKEKHANLKKVKDYQEKRKKAGKPRIKTPAETAKTTLEVISNKVEDGVTKTQAKSVANNLIESINETIKALDISLTKQKKIEAILKHALTQINKLLKS